MFVPPYKVILGALGISAEQLTQKEEVTIPTSLFRFLLQIAVKQSDFNEIGYLKMNPDVAEAARRGTDPRGHYINYGYFEGRFGATPDVDDRWYLSAYPDVQRAIASGTLRSASDHYWRGGISEFRSPRKELERECSEWRKLVTKLRLTANSRNQILEVTTPVAGPLEKEITTAEAGDKDGAPPQKKRFWK